MTTNYYAIIPAEVRYADIPPNAKLLYWEITALTNKEWFCWAWNEYFAELYGVNISTISRWISKLSKLWFLTIDFENKDLSKRKIYIWELKTVTTKTAKAYDNKINSLWQKEHKAYDKKVIHNNTSIILNNNIKNNNIYNDILLEKNDFSFFGSLNEILKDSDFIEKLKNKFWVENEDLKRSSENFLIYWTEKNPNGRKERREMQKIFDVKRRFYTRISNDSKFWKNKQIKKTVTFW